MKRKVTGLNSLSMAIAMTLVSTSVSAQDNATRSVDQDEATTLDAVVVSGTAKFKGLRKRDASFSISTLSPEQIQDAVPTSTADLFKVVPGIWVESSGGQSGANIDVRGFPGGSDAPFVTVQVEGSPLFPSPTLSFLENSSLFRIDDTIERMEALRGGPNPIYSNGQAGATINFLLKRGSDEPERLVRLTTGTGNLRRVDAFASGPLAPGWYYSLGGFVRQTDGVRKTQYPADKGGQFSATLSREWEGGDFMVYGRRTYDKNAFFNSIPLLSQDNGKRVASYPGLDARTGTLLGNDFRRVTLPVGPDGQSISRDMADGRGVDIGLLGGTLNWYVGDWTFSNRFNYLGGNADTNALFPTDVPVTLERYITSTYGTSGRGRFVNGGGSVAPEQPVLVAGWWTIQKDIRSFTNDFRVSRELLDGNTLTMGAYWADYRSNDTRYQGNNMLLTAENHARRINVELPDGRIATREGFVGAATSGIIGRFEGSNHALFVADEWQINERFRLDAGIRAERQSVTANLLNPVNMDLDGNPDTLYDNRASVPTIAVHLQTRDHHWSWTAGLNYKVNESASLFARANSGFKFPSFDDLRKNALNTQEVRQYEVGLKAGSQLYDLYLTAFYNDFTGLPYTAVLVDGSDYLAIGDSSAYGLEFEGALRPAGAFQVALSGAWMRGEYDNFGTTSKGRFVDYSGNRIQRQPRLQTRLTPSYYWTLPRGDLTVHTTWAYVGRRFSDVANGQPLPSYSTLSAGVRMNLAQKWELALLGGNLTNRLGLTQGNARIVGNATTDGVFMGRPIEGRSFQFSTAYRW